MTTVPPKQRLGEVLKVEIDAVPVNPAETYQFAGVYSFGRGLFVRGDLSGANTTYKKFHRLRAGMFVMSQPKGWEGALARVSDDFDGFFLSPVYPTFVVDSDRLDAKFLEWYFKQSHTWDELKRLSKGMGARRNSVYPAMLLSLQIPLPPLSEQRRIVAKIDWLAAKVEEAKGLRANTTQGIEAFRTAAFRAIFESRRFSSPSDTPVSETLSVLKQEKLNLVKNRAIRKPATLPKILDEEIPFILPRHSTWIRLESICHSVNDGTHQTPTYTDSGRIFLSAQNVKPYKFMPETHRCVSQYDYEKYVSKVKPELGDILMTRVGAGIGETAMIDKPIDFAIYVSLCLIKPLQSYVNRDFLVHWLNSPYGAKAAKERTLGRGSSQGNLNLAFIRHFVIPFPPVEEQRRIVDALDGLQSKTEQMKALQAKTAAAMDAMLPSILDRAFTGKL
jgi:type I restriction enzyme S subunit